MKFKKKIRICYEFFKERNSKKIFISNYLLISIVFTVFGSIFG